MTDLRVPDAAMPVPANARTASHAAIAPCEECLGSGGWFRYEPAMEPSPGLLYLSCLHCRGTGHTAEGRG